MKWWFLTFSAQICYYLLKVGLEDHSKKCENIKPHSDKSMKTDEAKVEKKLITI